MKTKGKNNILITVILATIFIGCKSLQTSRYARYNQFRYTAEQPTFHFQNDQLGIAGEWWWASGNRAVPHPSYLPSDIRKILKPITRKNGKILFCTWSPQQRSFSVAGDLRVTKNDVRKLDSIIKPFYEVVLIHEGAFSPDPKKYKSAGKTNDYQFDLYIHTEKVSPEYEAWQLIAAEKDSYYDFVCIADTSYFRESYRAQQQSLFIEDTKLYFEKTR